MDDSELKHLLTTLHQRWPATPDAKAQRYVGQFFDRQRVGARIRAKVTGNHGVYTVSIQVAGDTVQTACSCYIGKKVYCHHCVALAHTFLEDPSSFPVVERKERKDVQTLGDLKSYLAHITLESLIVQLKARGITQTAFAQSIGCSTQHLAAVKRSELRNHFFHELGAMKLACLWVLEHADELNLEKKRGE
jgi:uncharacterized Zn finger protein